MADLERIQFKRTTTAGKVPQPAQLSDGELAINLADKAIYTKSGSSVIQLTGQGMPEINTDKVVVNPKTPEVNGPVTIEDGLITFENKKLSDGAVDSTVRHLQGKNALNDGWYIGSGGESNKGYLEIGTIDDGDEEIRFVQRGSGNSIRRTAKILDGSGHTRIPGNLYSDGNSVIIKDKAYFGSGGADIYMRNSAGGNDNQLTITDSKDILFRGKQVFWKDNPPNKSEIGLPRVSDVRQLQYENWPVGTSDSERWVKIGRVRYSANSTSRLSLMISNGGNYGSRETSTDFVSISGRGISTSTVLSANNINSVITARRLGDAALKFDQQLRYYARIDADGLELWVRQRAFISGVQFAVLAQDGGIIFITNENGGPVVQTTQPDGVVEATAFRVYDEAFKPDFNDGSITGVLSIEKGGTGGTSQAAARNNLGLKTAAVRDVGLNSGQLMEVGAYGLGGLGSSFTISTARDLLKELRKNGSMYFRNTVAADNGVYGMGAGFYSSVSDVHSVITVDWNSANVRVMSANNTNINSDTGRININTLYGTANKPKPDDVGAVDRTGDTMTGNLTVKAQVEGNILKALGTGSADNPPSQGAYITWNRQSGSGRTNFMNNRGSGAGGFEWINGSKDSWSELANLDASGNFKAAGNLKANNTQFGTDGNITGGSMFGGNLNTYLNQIKSDINTADTAAVKKSGDRMTGALTIEASTGADGYLLDLKSSTAHTPLLLERNTTSNLSIGFKLSSGNIKRLGIDVNRELRWGEVANLSDNDMILTTGNLDTPFKKGNTDNKSAYEMANLGGTAPKGSPGSAGNVWAGGLRIYDTSTGVEDGYPTQYGLVLSSRAGEYRHFQFFASSDSAVLNNGLYYRSMRGGSENSGNNWEQIALATQQNRFKALQVFERGANFDEGSRFNKNIGIGVNASTSSDPSVTFAAGSTIREGTGAGLGALVISSGTVSGSVNYISLRPQNANSSAISVTVEADATVQLNSSNTDAGFFANNVRFRSGGTDKNSLYLEANTANLFLRPRRGSDTNGFTISNATGSMLQNAAQGSEANALTRRDFVNSQVATRLPLAGGTMTGNIIMGGSTQIANSTKPTAGAHLTNKDYVDQEVTKAINGAGTLYLPLTGGTVTGTLTVDNVGAIDKKGIRTYKDGDVTVNETDGIKMFGNNSVAGTLRLVERVNNTTFIGLQTSLDANNNGWFEFHHNGMLRANHAELTTGLRVKGSPIIQPTSDNNAWASINFRHTDGTTNRGILFADAAGNIGFSNINGKNVIWNTGNYFIIQQGELNVGVNNGGTGENNEDRNKANFYNKGSIDCAGTRAYQDANAGNRWVREVRGVRHIMQGTDLGSENIFVERVGERHFHMLHVFGANNNGWFEFRNNGDMSCNGTLYAKDVYITSDKRHKRNITKVENSEEILNKLSAYNYEVRDPTADNSWEKSTGLIAQEVQDVLPAAVNDSDPEHIRLNYNAIVAVLVDQVNKLTAKVNELEKKLINP